MCSEDKELEKYCADLLRDAGCSGDILGNYIEVAYEVSGGYEKGIEDGSETEG